MLTLCSIPSPHATPPLTPGSQPGVSLSLEAIGRLSDLGFAEYLAMLIRPLLCEPPAGPCCEPRVHLRDWLAYIMRRGEIGRYCMLQAVFVLEKISKTSQKLHRNNLYRFSLAAVMIACKTVEDTTYSLADWAVVGMGFYRPQLLADVEINTLCAVRWQTTEAAPVLERLIATTVCPDDSTGHPVFVEQGFWEHFWVPTETVCNNS